MAAAESVPAGTKILPGCGLINRALTMGQQALQTVVKILDSAVATKSTENQDVCLLSKAFLETCVCKRGVGGSQFRHLTVLWWCSSLRRMKWRMGVWAYKGHVVRRFTVRKRWARVRALFLSDSKSCVVSCDISAVLVCPQTVPCYLSY